ncbi:MAG: hypothetical protein JWP58_2072 [Hymenobacter sp.]|nr:hypothetical protein [Hymenobacter sp.]
MQGKLDVTEDKGTYYFGQRVTLHNSSGKQIAVYCKSDEIVRSGKEYISAYHRHNGLDTERPIVRVEVRYNIKLLHLPYFDATGSFDPNWFSPEHLESLFKEGVGCSFQFRDLTRPRRDAHRNLKYPVITLMDFDFLRQLPMERAQCFDQQRSNDRANASTVRGLVNEYIKHNAPETLAELQRFILVNTVPERTNWRLRIERYAHQYRDAPNPEEMQRLESIAQQLKY